MLLLIYVDVNMFEVMVDIINLHSLFLYKVLDIHIYSHQLYNFHDKILHFDRGLVHIVSLLQWYIYA